MILPNALLFGLGLAAMAIPLWVHLRLGKVKKRAVVPTLRLMKATPQTSRTPRRFVDIPLLLLRLLLLLLIALAFGRLSIAWLAGKDAVEHVVMVLDVSGSMQAQDGKVWEQAQEEALTALGKLHGSSRVAVVLSPQGQSQPEWEAPAQAIRRINALKPGYGANRLGAAIRSAGQLLANMTEDHPKVLHIVSDFQRSAFVDIDSAVIASDVELRISKAGPEKLTNRGISVEMASAGMTDVGVYGFNDGGSGKLKLEENGKARELTISPGQDAARLTHSGNKQQTVTRKLSIEDTDALAADNVAWDVYQAQEDLPVWLWEPSSTAQRVYEQASYFLSRGLQPTTDADSAPASRYRPIVLNERDLAGALDKAGTTDAPRLLFVPASKDLPEPLITIVRKLTNAGGSVVFFGGPSLDAAAYETAFGSLLGVKVGEAVEIKGTQVLAPIAGNNLLWGGLDLASRLQLAEAPLHRHHALEVAPGTRALATYADGTPFVLECTAGSGHVFFVNASSDRAWGDWPASAPQFVPALHLLAARALGDSSAASSLKPVPAGEPVTLRLSREYAGKSLKLGDDRWPIDDEGRVKRVIFPKPGVVDLTLDNGAKAGTIAVNFPAPESTLESDSPAVARQRLESLRQQSGGPAIRWESDNQGSLAWKLCLFGAALLLLLEPIVANRRKQV